MNFGSIAQLVSHATDVVDKLIEGGFAHASQRDEAIEHLVAHLQEPGPDVATDYEAAKAAAHKRTSDR